MAGDSQTSQSPDSPPPENPEQSSQEEQQQPQRRRRKPKHDFPQTQAGKLWDAFGNPEEPINTMPGGTYNTAGGRPREYTWRDVFSLTKEDANRFWRTGCANDALTVGMLGGAGVMGARFIWGGVKQSRQAANWGVSTFSLMSLGIYTWCERRRRQEAIGMTQAVAGMKKMHDKKKQEEEEEKQKAEAAARLIEEEQKKKSWTNPSNYKFW